MIDINNIKILYILGTGHSGSTILQLALATNNYLFPVGELYTYLNLGNKRFRGDFYRCDCGRSIDKCPFWKKVFISKSNNYYDVLFNVVKIANRAYVIDASKWSEPLYFLRKYKDNVYVVYLVRDGRGTLYSYYKKYRKTLRYVVFWVVYNIKAWFFARYYSHRIFIHYDDFCKEPIKTLEYIFKKFKIPYNKKDLLKFENIERHTLAGNLRFVKKIESIKCHDEWKKKLNIYQKLQFYLLAGWLNLYFNAKRRYT